MQISSGVSLKGEHLLFDASRRSALIVFHHEAHEEDEVREKHCYSFSYLRELRALRGEQRIQDNIPTV